MHLHPALVLLLLSACGGPGSKGRPVETAETGLPLAAPPNLLLVIADDLGVDKVGFSGLGTNPPATPTLDGLASEGRVFTRAWAHPVCSPARAAILSGQHAWRTGIGLAVQPQQDTVSLDPATTSLPELLATAPTPYASAALGKWHLGTWAGDDGLDPLVHGFGHHAGSLANLRQPHAFDGAPQSYTDWEKSVDGERSRTTTYATTDTTDEALAAVRSMPEPWLAWVAYNAPHSPYHAPPEHLFPGPEPSGTVDRYDAMVTAWDAELGRLLDGLEPAVRARTVVVVLGDNGTPAEAVQPPLSPGQAKQSVYEGGVRVPLVVVGPGIEPGQSDALVSALDLFATFADLAGVSELPAEVDAVSLVPVLHDPARAVRQTVLTERFLPNGDGPKQVWDRAVRDADYKLVRTLEGQELYALGPDWLEGEDLLAGDPLDPAAAAALERLEAVLDATTPEGW